jgi:hypothetical protein
MDINGWKWISLAGGNRVSMGRNGHRLPRDQEIRNITITPDILKLIAEIDEFKGRWKVMESLAPEKAH